jgi:hypothetical protein
MTSSAQSLAPGASSDWNGTARYAIVRRIGEGGMGVVYDALDRELGRRVAVKTLRRVDAASLLQLKNEFRSLADVQHRNLVRLHELVVGDDAAVFFTMELVTGADFVAHVQGAHRLEHPYDPSNTVSSATLPVGQARSPESVLPAVAGGARSSPADLEILRPALRQLVEGLQALHAGGKLHRDIKPSNVLVTPEGRVVLLDFGVAKDLRRSLTGPVDADGAVVGTPRYMSPEQALGEALTPASDWYCVGVVLYEALVGHTPFEGSAMDVLVSKSTLEAPPPSDSVVGVPPDLDELCSALLRIDPVQRPTGGEILRVLGATRGTLAVSSSPPGDGALALGVVGRETQQRALREALATTRAGHAVTMRVGGLAGMGKSSLVQQFIDEELRSGEINVLFGRVYERESLPYKAVDAVIDALSHHLVRQEEEEGLALPRHMWALAHLFPVLKRIPSVAALPVAAIDDGQRVRRRAFRALRDLLASIARRRPLVVLIDDVQWGDTESVALLQEVTRQPGAPPLLLVLTYREEDAETSPFLREMTARWLDAPTESAEVCELRVGPLDGADARRLALSLIGRTDEIARRTAAAVARESRGSPLLIEELVRSNRGDAAADGATLDVLTLDQIIFARLEQLPDDARRLAEIIAVAGRPLPTLTVAAAANIPGDAEEPVAILTAQRLVRAAFRDGQDVVEPRYDRIRETIVSQLAPSVLRERHLALVRVLEGMPGADPESLALHALGGGELPLAAHYAELAAEQAAEKLAFDQSARLYRLVLETRDAIDRAAGATTAEAASEKHRLRIKVAKALEDGGRASEAGDMYLTAAGTASGIERIELERAGAEQLIACGRVDRGEVALRGVLTTMGIAAPRSALSAVFWLLVYRIWLRCIGHRFRERGPEEVSREDRVKVDALAAVCIALGHIDVILGACLTARQMILALAVGDRAQVAIAMGTHIVQSAVQGRPESARERELLGVVKRLATNTGVEGEAQTSLPGHLARVLGLSKYYRGAYAEAIELFDADRRTRKHRVVGDTNGDLYACYACFYIGRLREQGRRARRLLREVEDRGDVYTAVSLRCTVMVDQSLMADDPDAARRHLRDAMAQWAQHATKGFHLQHWYAMLWEAQTELYAGNAEVALQRIERDRSALKKSFLLYAAQVRAISAFTTGCCALAAAIEGGAESRAARLDQAARSAQVLEKLGKAADSPWMAHALRAGLANAAGERAVALERLCAALESAESASIVTYAAAVRHRLGALTGGEPGARLVADAEKALTAEGVRAPARWAAMVVPGRWR